MKRCLVIHGPNLNLLGDREEHFYGKLALKDIDERLIEFGNSINLEIVTRQSNSEGEIVTWIQEAKGIADGIIINPAAYSHTSVAIRDALLAVNIPTIEIHMSNLFSRETFRHNSVISDVVLGRIEGFGWKSYVYGINAISDIVNEE